MKRYMLCIYFFMCVVLSHAQTISVNQIKNVMWEEIEPSDPYCKGMIYFSNTDFFQSTLYLDGIVNGKVNTNNHKYYLSPTKPRKFDKSLVGKNTKGKYLVVYVRNKELYVFEIESVTKDKLKIKYNSGEVFTYRKSK